MIVELERRVAGLPTKHKRWREAAERCEGVESARGRETLASRSRGEWAHALNVVDRYSSVRAENQAYWFRGRANGDGL